VEEMRIELYLNSDEYMEKGVSVKPQYLRHFRGQVSDEYDDLLLTKQVFTELPDELKKLQNLLEDLAFKHDIEMYVYDTTRIRDSIKAFFKGIRKIPTVIIGRQKLTGNITKEQIIEAIKKSINVKL